MEELYWKDKNFSFFSNKECEYFPCHECGDTTNFNCLFCYCPLYLAGKNCGGNFKYTKDGIKDCSDCPIPHLRENYGYIIDKFTEISNEMRNCSGKDQN